MADTMETTQAPASGDLRQQVEAQLATCRDPEIGLDIMSLGLVYEVIIDEGSVLVKMTLTAIGCPWAQDLFDEVKTKVEAVPGVKACPGQPGYSPPWSADSLADAPNMAPRSPRTAGEGGPAACGTPRVRAPRPEPASTAARSTSGPDGPGVPPDSLGATAAGRPGATPRRCPGATSRRCPGAGSSSGPHPRRAGGRRQARAIPFRGRRDAGEHEPQRSARSRAAPPDQGRRP